MVVSNKAVTEPDIASGKVEVIRCPFVAVKFVPFLVHNLSPYL